MKGIVAVAWISVFPGSGLVAFCVSQVRGKRCCLQVLCPFLTFGCLLKETKLSCFGDRSCLRAGSRGCTSVISRTKLRRIDRTNGTRSKAWVIFCPSEPQKRYVILVGVFSYVPVSKTTFSDSNRTMCHQQQWKRVFWACPKATFVTVDVLCCCFTQTMFDWKLAKLTCSFWMQSAFKFCLTEGTLDDV